MLFTFQKNQHPTAKTSDSKIIITPNSIHTFEYINDYFYDFKSNKKKTRKKI